MSLAPVNKEVTTIKHDEDVVEKVLIVDENVTTSNVVEKES